MKNELSDEQVDSLLRQLVRDASATDETIDEIVGSPALWWSVQREIRQDVAAAWPPPISKYWKWIIAAVPVAAAIVLTALFFNAPQSATRDAVAMADAPVQTAAQPRVDTPEQPTGNVESSSETMTPRHTTAARTVRASSPAARPRTRLADTTAIRSREEVKTEFISLTYAQKPSSGQIVRVKVPSAMMVDLGVVASVQKPASLVDAEVVIGDDGMTHAIRFIRGQ